MEKNLITSIIKEYAQQSELYNEFTLKCKQLVEEFLKGNNVNVHSVTCRVKKQADLLNKLKRSEQKYARLCDVTDISGIRIITYFADEVDKVAEIIQKEFDIDRDKSVDKRALLDPDRFGYISLHFVAKLPPIRLVLTEYSNFSDCKTEIQIRSILQHTWAEIEHDLGYKNMQAVPKELRRGFSRLAGLLELADDEFVRIRDSLREYETKVIKQVADAPSLVLIDKASLSAFLKHNLLIHKIDDGITSLTSGEVKGHMDDDTLSSTVEILNYVGLKNIADIESSLRKFEAMIYSFAKAWAQRRCPALGGLYRPNRKRAVSQFLSCIW